MNTFLARVLIALPVTVMAVTVGIAQRAVHPTAVPAPSPDPIVLQGRRLPSLIGKRPADIVGFAFRNNTWKQIPVQIDERARLPFHQVLNRTVAGELESTFYTDPNTFTGADPDPKFDADDECVWLAADCGDRAGQTSPKGVRAATRVEVIVRRGETEFGRVYLFERASDKLDPAAGADHVAYAFRLKSGNYKDTYRLRVGRNPEQSTITTSSYRAGFTDRWVFDELRLTVGETAGADILDRHKIQVIPGNCVRTTKTFSRGGGAIIANIDGPIRAIRSVIGANSGPLTERLWICYPCRMDIVTHLRVHALPSSLMFFDYSADAIGMRYHDNNNKAGAIIDGKPDAIVCGELEWQFVTGEQGSLLLHYVLDTTMKKLVMGSLYDDSERPKWSQCTGDRHAYGACGPLTGALSNTDPRRRNAHRMVSTVVLYPGRPNRKLRELGTIQTPPQWSIRVVE